MEMYQISSNKSFRTVFFFVMSYYIFVTNSTDIRIKHSPTLAVRKRFSVKNFSKCNENFFSSQNPTLFKRIERFWITRTVFSWGFLKFSSNQCAALLGVQWKKCTSNRLSQMSSMPSTILLEIFLLISIKENRSKVFIECIRVNAPSD